ncbi:hypothetical protein C8Q72DRAFT_946198 [Fomitopsis betulina]|nr:hypothetical protein C8Q72DRAFT_946198 [Fomitopsis betulina]
MIAHPPPPPDTLSLALYRTDNAAGVYPAQSSAEVHDTLGGVSPDSNSAMTFLQYPQGMPITSPPQCGPVRATGTKRPAQRTPYESERRKVASSPEPTPSLSSTASTPSSESVSWPATPHRLQLALPVPLEDISFLQIKFTKPRNARLDITDEQFHEALSFAPRHVYSATRECLLTTWSGIFGRTSNRGPRPYARASPGCRSPTTARSVTSIDSRTRVRFMLGAVFNRKDSYMRHVAGDTSKCLQRAGAHSTGILLSRKGNCNMWGVAKMETRDLTTRLFSLRFLQSISKP